MLKFYTGFEINDQTGNALTQKEMTNLHYDRITSLQVNALRCDRQLHISAACTALLALLLLLFFIECSLDAQDESAVLGSAFYSLDNKP